jgi:uncharacterized membrane protein (UPF0127 family)
MKHHTLLPAAVLLTTLLAPLVQGAAWAGTTLDLKAGGQVLHVKAIGGDLERREMLSAVPKLGDGEALLFLYPKPRYQFALLAKIPEYTVHVYFLSSLFSVLEAQTLSSTQSVPGLSSSSEAQYVLVTPMSAPPLSRGDTLEGWAAAVASVPVDKFPEVVIGKTRIPVEIVETMSAIELGVMFRRKMSADEGMLFVYGTAEPRAHWMGHCYFPLSIAFAGADGTINALHDMPPYAEPENPGKNPKTWSSKGPAKYALETNIGFFREHGIKSGMKLVPPAP